MVRNIGKIFNNRFFIFIAIVTLTVDFMYLTYNQWKPDHNRDNNDYDDNVETIKINNDELPSNTEIYSNNNENIEDDFDDVFVFKKRPREDYMIDLNNILENCDMNKKYIHECLKYLGEQESDYMVPKLANNDSSENELMLFHVYWKGAINDKLSLMIKSFLYTQKLDNSKLYIWLDKINEDLKRNHYSKELLHFSPKYIEFKEWNTEKQLTKNNLYSGWEKILVEHVGTVSFSDLVRFVVLHNYGGIYIDADVLLLRDMSPLYNSDFEFSYRWSYLEDYNTAVLRLRANSTTSRKIIEGAMKNQMNFHPFAVKNYLLSSQSFLEDEGNIDTMSELNRNLYMLPVPLFDPLWLKKDKVQIDNLITPNLSNFSDVFEVELLEDEFPHTAITDNVDKNSIEEDENDDNYNLDYNLNHQDLIIKLRKPHRFFSGAFTYHWHNNWKTKILPTSWFGILKKSYDRFLSGNDPNLYNEYFPINKNKII